MEKRSYPFFFQFLLCFLFLDGLEKGWVVVSQGVFFQFPYSFFLSLAFLDFLALVQIVFRYSFVQWWLAFYFFMRLCFQALFFTYVSPESWLAIGDGERFLQIFTALFYLTLLFYLFSEEWQTTMEEKR